ncbi:lipopolysaccharide biosynthesis protein [Haloarcula marismortui]|uniref:Lipopolysaccharide biosynthesis protein n=1 Tax=Haloarcula marismortui ATCC 33800 TaxID=662476 RepID=M0JM40_9EURY|nr:lipopolysaccharide biosynthesis protein [Haloarcula sinaiiensis]EMA08755.1 membrane protein involved in the export of O-antigen and teichoic acid [Haloarcula sinaiiensis ATCC 33800]QUJ74347.1 lipopolysaccharide biosynthesis protein [Haloarcula sinaiiensis ATCC 33800]
MIPTGGVAERAVKSGIWMAGQNAFGRALQLVMLIILARLIGPSQVGLMGIALLTLSGVRKFTKMGLNSQLIQQADSNVDSYLNTTWILEATRGAVILTILVVAAPFIAQVFDSPQATDMIRVIGISPLILGLQNPGVVYFSKNLDFHKRFVYYLSGQVLQLVVAVGYALYDPTAWAFIIGFISADVMKLVLSYLLHDYRPWPSFDRAKAGELVDYGKWLTGSSILYWVYSEGDDAFVGWLLTPAVLGFYQYAYRFSNAPATEIAQVVSSVMFPALSKLKEDTSKLREAYLQTLRVTTFVAFPAAMGIMVIAPSFVKVFLGSEWETMIPVMQILAIFGLLRAVSKTFGPLWKAVGRPDYIMKLSFIRVVLLAIFIWPATEAYGIVGTALVVTGVFIFPMMPMNIYITVKTIDANFKQVFRELFYPLVASGTMAAVCLYTASLLDVRPIIELPVLIILGVVVYTVLVLFLESQFNWGVRQNFETVVSSIKA